MKNKKLIGAIVGVLLAVLGALKAYVDAPETSKPVPVKVIEAADAGA